VQSGLRQLLCGQPPHVFVEAPSKNNKSKKVVVVVEKCSATPPMFPTSILFQSSVSIGTNIIVELGGDGGGGLVSSFFLLFLNRLNLMGEPP
jgi:hypothetical protein